MRESRIPYWWRFAALAVASLGLLFLFVFGFLPQRFLLELDFNESGFAYPVIRPSAYSPPPPPVPGRVLRPTARGPAERFWATYLPLLESGEHEAASQVLAAYLEAHPGDRAAWEEQARVLWHLGRLTAADAAYVRALELGADDGIKLERARLLAAAQRWDHAVSVFEELVAATADDPSPPLLREFAELAVWTERYERALALYARLAELAPGDPEPLFRTAQILYWTNQLKGAAELLASLPEGIARARVDSLRSAIAAALPPPAAPGTEIEANPLEVARGLVLEGAVDSALAIYRRQLASLNGTEADSLLLELADVFEYRAGAPDSAMGYLRLYLARHPEDERVRLRLARRLGWSGRLSAAQAEAERILSARPDNAEAWVLLGDLHRWRGSRDEAERAYERALAVNGSESGAPAPALEGLEALRRQADAELAREGNIGPSTGFGYFSDSDDFTLASWAGEYRFGSPSTRAALALDVESLGGRGLASGEGDLTAFEIAAVGERWWLDGSLHTTASLGLWIPESKTDAQPTGGLALTVPDWRGGTYRFIYEGGPAFRETTTFEAAVAGLRSDAVVVESYRPLGERWDVSAAAGLALFSGAGPSNVRATARLGVLFRARRDWTFGYETFLLSFADPSPDPGRRLYWDPQLYWVHSAVLGFSGAPGPDWGFELRATPGVAFVNERADGTSLVPTLGVLVAGERTWGRWALRGGAGLGQSRTDGYRAFRFDLGLARSIE